MNREIARSLLNGDEFLPPGKYGERIVLGRIAHGMDNNHQNNNDNSPILPDDPRLTKTYVEFPLESLDVLLDAACQYLGKDSSCMQRPYVTMVDIGSGLGRIVLYVSLTRGRGEGGEEEEEEEGGGGEMAEKDHKKGPQPYSHILLPWHVHGIEIAPMLHNGAMEFVQKGIDNGLWNPSHPDDTNTSSLCSFHLGPAEDFSATILGNVDILFAYSTAFPAKRFSPEVGALILDPEWSEFLGRVCRPGCVAITTDRALDPLYGWECVDRIEVENRQVFGSTGYIHKLSDSLHRTARIKE
jgi:hypothetical protein